MCYEACKNAVEEVVEFSGKYKLLFGSIPPKDFELKIIHKIPDDFFHCGSDGKRYEDLLEEELSYSDIRSEELVEVYNELSRDKEKNSLAGRARRILKGRGQYLLGLQSVIPEDIDADGLISEFITDDLLFCCQYRAAFGKRPGFWETIFQIYKSGGMPVGWSGKYPEGRFMAIYPGLECK